MSELDDLKVEVVEMRPQPITDRVLAEKILNEMLTEEFAMSYSMALYSVQLVELTDKTRYKCVILFGTDIQTDIRRMTILMDATNMNSEIERVVNRVHMYLLNH